MRDSRFPGLHSTARSNGARGLSSFDSQHEDARIGVLGAGAAGLTVARSLAQKGYRNVTVLERDDRVGGKCSTFHHEGRSYELGAVVMTPGYSHVRALVKELALETEITASCAFVDVDSNRAQYLPPVVHEEPFHRVAASCVRLGVEAIRHRAALRSPGMRGMPEEMFVPFGEWARKAHVSDAARLVIEPLFTPLGYGYLMDAPAAYVLKYTTVFGAPFFELLQGGYQGLWETVARNLDVRKNVTVKRIRRGDGISVETSGETFTFDTLVVTSPLDEAIRFMDATSEETALAAQIKYNDYRVVVTEAEGLPQQRYIHLPKHFDSSTVGEVMFMYKRWRDRDVYISYAYGREGAPLEETIDITRETARRLGGRVKNVIRAQAWRYFPHVTCDAMQRGFFERFERMQGMRNTYYAGELLGLGTVETTVAQARDLVERHFVGRAGVQGEAHETSAAAE